MLCAPPPPVLQGALHVVQLDVVVQRSPPGIAVYKIHPVPVHVESAPIFPVSRCTSLELQQPVRAFGFSRSIGTQHNA